MAIDLHKNFAYSTLTNSPGTSGTSFIVQTGDGAKFPAVQFNATVWPAGVQPTGGSSGNAEIVRVTAISTDTFTVTRNGESGGATSINVAAGYQIAAVVSAKTLTDIEANYINSWTPYFPMTGTGLQTIANNSSNTGTNSFYVFPVTLPWPTKFNQVLIPQSLSYNVSVTTGTVSNSYYSLYGLYSMSAGSLLNLISSSSFSIGETLAENSTSYSLTWNYPTSTATSGWGYGSFPAGNFTGSVQIQSYISSTRVVGLHFGGEMSLSGGIYWMGLLSLRSTAGSSSSQGLSHAGFMGVAIHTINQPGTGNAMVPFGVMAADWATKNTNLTAWLGRQPTGFITATSAPNFSGSIVPQNISLPQIGAVVVASEGTILPSVTFVST